MSFNDYETKTLKKTCECGRDVEIEVRADIEINSYLTIKED